MNIIQHILIFYREIKSVAINRILRHRIQYYNPTLKCDHTVLWNYGYKWLDSIKLGHNVVIMPFTEIVVFKYTKYSSKEGVLEIGDNAVVTTAVNIRAAGGKIIIGKNSAIGEHSVLIAANHSLYNDITHINSPMDETRTDVIIGDNVWVGACCSLLPGCRIGDNSVVGAGSVVSKEIPANEIWAGVPAKRIRSLSCKTPEKSDA